MAQRGRKKKDISQPIDNVNHPAHYKTESGLEMIDVIDAFTQYLDGNEAYYVGNIFKYIGRFKKKNGLEDLRKAKWYLDRLILLKEDNHGTK